MSSLPNHQASPQPTERNAMSLSFTLALKDGALGTIPLTHQQSVLSLLEADAPHVVAAIPRLLSVLLTSIAHRGWQIYPRAVLETAAYIIVSVLELQLLVSASLLWLVFPGLALLPWLGLETVAIWLLLRYLNREQQAFTYVAGKNEDDGATAPAGQHLHWVVVGGMATSPESTHRVTLPKLAKLFGHDMHAFLPRRLGFPLDIAIVFLQRALHIPTARATALYDSVRTNLLKSQTNGVRILAHNTGTLDTAWVLSRLCADLPAGTLLSKLQVFTFGAASAEMALPLGSASTSYPTLTHFAFEEDPFAQMGVLLGVRRLEGRFAGSLYTLKSSRDPGPTASRLFPRCHKHTLDDYLDAMLPGGDPLAGVLGCVCKIDREVGEMRELAALAQSVDKMRQGTRKGTRTKRLSWTALGVVANSLSSGGGGHDDMAGAFSLDEVRRRGRALEGSKGYEGNPLAEAVQHRAEHQMAERASCGQAALH